MGQSNNMKNQISAFNNNHSIAYYNWCDDNDLLNYKNNFYLQKKNGKILHFMIEKKYF